MLRLHVAPATGAPFERPLDDVGDGVVTVGRAPDSDVTLDDRFVSRHHARFYRQTSDPADTWWIEDLGSQNGTFLNEARIAGPAAVRPGDVVRLCGSLVTLLSEDQPVPERSPPGAPAAVPRPETLVLRPARDLLAKPHEPPTASNASAAVLARYAGRLRLLNEVHHALGRSAEIQELLELILERVFEHLGPEEAAIYLRGSDGVLRLAAVRSLGGERTEDHLALSFSRSLAHEVVEKGLAALVVDAPTDRRFAAAESMALSGVRSIAAAPLVESDAVHGMIAVASRLHGRMFDEADLELLVSLASVAALHVRNRALAEDAAERHRMDRELALAREIQTGLLPAALPDVAGWALHGGSVPSRQVSGDYYLATHRDDGALIVMLVDVSGKGIAAALLTASVEALAAGFLELGLPPEEVCDRVCRGLLRRTPQEKFATAFVAVLDPTTGTFRYASAGHDPALLVRRGGGVERLGATGPPLGLVANARRAARELTFDVGDLLVLYTDGVTEASRKGGEEYGRGRLAGLCERRRELPLSALAAAIEEDVVLFTRGAPFQDDRTLVLLRRETLEE